MSSVQIQQALDYLSNVDFRNYSQLAESMHEDFTHRFLPASLGGIGKPVRSKQEYLDNLKSHESIFPRFNFQPPEEIIEGKNVVVLHFHSDATTTSGNPYKNEYVLTIRFEGEKIISVKEFFDSQYVIKTLEAEGMKREI